MSDTRTPCALPPIMRKTSPRQAAINSYIRSEVEKGRGVPSKRKVTMKFGKSEENLRQLLTRSFERSGLLKPKREPVL